VHAWLPAKLKRRTVSAAVAVAVAALAVTAAVLAGSGPAQASTGTVSVAIDSMSPAYARPGDTVRLTGTVTNRTSQARAGLEIQVYTLASSFQTRSAMDSYLSRGLDQAPEMPGAPFFIQGSLGPGATARWSVSFKISDAGITGFGVYPVTASAVDAAGGLLASDRTLLPFWPGPQAADLKQPLNIAWAWPLIDQPQHQACSPALASNDLAASLSDGGRLSVLLDAGKAHPEADLTWVIDPALLGDVATMQAPYFVGSKPNCTGPRPEPASKAAAAWLASLRAVLRSAPSQQAVITPYANVDMTALVHRGLNADLARAFQLGGIVAHDVLHQDLRPSIAWPAGGTADQSVLTSLAAAEHVGTVVLNGSEMPYTPSAVYHGSDAVTSIRTGAGTTMNVLLADDTLTGVLRAADTGSGAEPLPQSTEFAVKQRFLAETAMIAAQEPNSARSIVVAPPSGWSPTAGLAGDLLAETGHTPWLQPTALSDLTAAQDSERTVSRTPPPASKASPGELGRGYLGQVARVGERLAVYKSMLYRARPSYVQSLDEALAATESSAWRGSGTAAGAERRTSLSQYLRGAEKRVHIISSSVSMGGASGAVPVTIQNGLLNQAIEVRLTTSVENTPGRASQLTAGPFRKLIVVQPQQVVTVRLPVSSAPQGSTVIQLGLTSANGTPLPFGGAQLTVVSTRYGRAILFLIGAAIGVLVLTSLYRAVRGWLHDDRHAVASQAGQPGSVVTGSSGPRYPTEAPDDLADARRWADDA
jgi:hypothetical protein